MEGLKICKEGVLFAVKLMLTLIITMLLLCIYSRLIEEPRQDLLYGKLDESLQTNNPMYIYKFRMVHKLRTDAI